MDEVTVATQTSLENPDETADVSRQLVFETEDTIVIQSRVAGGITTGWHHNGDRHAYGYVVEGHALLEYGPAGEDSVGLSEGDFVYVPPRTIRRVVNPTTENWVIVISFVGSGPPATPVNAPQPETEL
ncbi:cupin domain-containing protein [Halorubrum sp. HHNYT27]|uniref:cupin domain-containing protein n=1 Tax=Halorubrum sp. HHNYT27 TaxID=3402275 RepID=UPI003EB9D428